MRNLAILFFLIINSLNFNLMAQKPSAENSKINLFLCGDVMTGRGIDQILPHSVDPVLYEPYVKNAKNYVQLAEKENGQISHSVDYKYIWGDAMQVWQQMAPDLKIINLETSITTHDEPWPGKGIHYRMHPENTPVLTAAGIDFCSLANNHVLDWQRPGLVETLNTLDKHQVTYAGAGEDLITAMQPAQFNLSQGKVLIFAYGMESSGIFESWAPGAHQSGVNVLPNLSQTTVEMVEAQIKEFAQPEDLVIVSIHWGGNWGYPIPQSQQDFAHQLIDHAEVDLIHGHSSHHPKGMEVYKEKLIIYGAGDFINDYEGISGQEIYRDDLCLMYFPSYELTTNQLISLQLVPMQIKKMKLNRPEEKDIKWLLTTMQRECEPFNLAVELKNEMTYQVKW